MSHIFERREFVIFNVSEIPIVNFQQVLETSAQTLRLSVNGQKTFVKWEGHDIPSFVQNLTTKEGPYTYEEIMEILNTEEWTVYPNMP
jgi:hypothetical protein